MTDRQQIQDQLARWQSELVTIKMDMNDPEQACINYGLDGDFCFVFKKNLEREVNQVETTIATLRKDLRIYDALVGTWAINFQDQSGNCLGRFNITSLNSGRTFLGTMDLIDTSQATPISGSYGDSNQEISFTRALPEGLAQQYTGRVNFSAQPPTMKGVMTWLLPPDTAVDKPPPSSWTAQKQAQ